LQDIISQYTVASKEIENGTLMIFGKLLFETRMQSVIDTASFAVT
jgi:hypothetical protein